jgi:CheY-like chemotaxis protein
MADDRKTKTEQTRIILVAMQDAYERNYASMLLQRFGYHVCTVNRPKEAAKFLSEAVPALVIADEALASSGGFDLLATLKRDGGTNAVPAILVSLSPDPGGVQQYRDAGYADVLSIPLTAEMLYRAVQKQIEPYPRQNVRVSVYLKADLGGGPAGLAQYATVLSENGMFVRTTVAKPVNTRLPVSLVIGDRTIKAEAVVLYSYGFDDYPLKELGMGIRFVKINPEDQALIRSFIKEEIEKDIGKRP